MRMGWVGLDWGGLDWFGLVRIGWDCVGLDWLGWEARRLCFATVLKSFEIDFGSRFKSHQLNLT